jgi:hypothetical protein
MEFTSLFDALISLIPIYGPWIIFGVVAFESAGVPLPGETILEKMFAERQGVDAETNQKLMAKHHMQVVGPPLR